MRDNLGPLPGPGDPDCERWPQVHECPGPGCLYPLRPSYRRLAEPAANEQSGPPPQQ